MKKTLLLTLCLALTLVVTSVAQAQLARVNVVVRDLQEEPIEDVKATIKNEEINFLETKESDRKGRIKLAFLDGTVRYEITFEREGYQPIVVNLKPQVGLSMKREYMMKTIAEAQAEAGAASAAGGSTAAGATDGQTAAPSAPVRKFTPAQTSFNEGVEALKVNDYDTAEQKFLGALALDDKLTVAHSALASVYIEKGDGANALAQSNLFLAAEPENPRSFRLLYESHRLLGDDAAAQEALKNLEKVAGGERAAALRYNEGTEALKSGDYDTAKRLLEEALAADPSLMDAVKALAILSINQRDFSRAASLADQFLTTRPDDKDITMMKIRWQSYSALGNTEQATAAFEALKAEDPTVVIKDLVEAAQVDFNNGRTDAAVARLEQILSIDADHARTHYLLGLCRINQGNNDEAKRLIQRFLELAPNDPQAAEAKEMLSFI